MLRIHQWSGHTTISWLVFGLLMADGIRCVSAFQLEASVPFQTLKSIRLCMTFLSVTHFVSLPSVPSNESGGLRFFNRYLTYQIRVFIIMTSVVP